MTSTLGGNLTSSNKTKGFTVIELIIVIVIIGIMSTIVVLVYDGYIKSVNTKKNQNVAALLQKSVEKYNSNNLTYPVSMSASTPGWQYYTANNSNAADIIPSGLTVQVSAPTANTTVGTVAYNACAATVNTSPATGYYISYWNSSTNAINYVIGGAATATLTGGVYVAPVACPGGTTPSTL